MAQKGELRVALLRRRSRVEEVLSLRDVEGGIERELVELRVVELRELEVDNALREVKGEKLCVEEAARNE